MAEDLAEISVREVMENVVLPLNLSNTAQKSRNLKTHY